MIFHHFFFSATSVSNDSLYRCLHNVAIYGKSCVAIFAFISGYGYYIVSAKEKRNCLCAGIKRISRFYPFFLFMCALHLVLAFLFPHGNVLQTENWKDIILNTVGLKGAIPDYWYIRIILLTALIYYPILLYAKRHNERAHLCTIFALLAITTMLHYLPAIASICFSYEVQYTPWMNFIRRSAHYALYLLFFMTGWSTCYATENKTFCKFLVPTAAGALSFMIADSTTMTVTCCIVIALLLPKFSKRCTCIFTALGTCSMAMWLNHRLIYGYWFSSFFYSIPTPLNYIILVLLSYIVAHFSMKGWNWITNGNKAPA